MTCVLSQLLYVAICIAIVEFPSATCEKKSQLPPIFDPTLKERLQSSPINLSFSCLEDFSLYLDQLEEGATWALNMFDSSAKLESGVLKGGHTFLGFYSGCIDALPENAAVPGSRDNSTVALCFSSKYCLSTMRLTSDLQVIRKTQLTAMCGRLEGVDLTFAVCVPSTCNEEDVGKITALFLRELGCTANVTSTVCRRPRQPFYEDAPALVVATFLAILAAVVLGATLFDCKQRQNVRKCDNPSGSVGSPKNKISHLSNGQPETKHVNCGRSALLCFSLLQNAKKVLGSDNPQSGSIRVLHGLRFFSMALVILLHNQPTASLMGIIRDVDALKEDNFFTKIARRGGLATDTFFFMGGLVVTYSTLKQLHKSGGKKNWLLFYVHRYLRTVPMVMVVVAISAFLMRHFGNGPRWADFLAIFETNCRISWWTNLLYVQNFVLLDKQCLIQTWYSAADFQFYLITPPILYALYKKPRLGVFIIAVLSIASITLSAIYSGLMARRFTNKDYDYFRDVYTKPYFRISSYLLGMVMGFFLSNRQKTVCPPRKRYVYLGWILCAFCLLFPIYGLWMSSPILPTGWKGPFLAIASFLWALGIAWIVYACVAGCGGIFNSVLSSQALEPLSKLTFSTYIIHASVMEIFWANLEDSFYYSPFLMSYIFAGHLLLSYAVSVIFCLFIELPIFGIERLLLRG